MFVHLEIEPISCSDGVDWITDFGKDADDLLVFTTFGGPSALAIDVYDVDGDDAQDTVITFGGGTSGTGAIVLLDYNYNEDGGSFDTVELAGLPIHIFSSTDMRP